jgi:putative membrane protein
MRSTVRSHALALTTILSVISLGLIFGVVGGVVPSQLLPRAPDTVLAALPHLNAALSGLALIAIVAGLAAIRRGDVQTHQRRMGAAFGLFVGFLVSYLYRITIEGPTSFGGPAVVEPVYYLLLAIHVGLAILSLPLLYYVLLLAYGYDADELAATNHPRVGRIAAPLWAISFVLGIVVYLALYVVFPA